jgi:uncharacterized membrane protein
MKNFKKEFLLKKRVLIPAVVVIGAFVGNLFGIHINEQSLQDLLNALANLMQ